MKKIFQAFSLLAISILLSLTIIEFIIRLSGLFNDERAAILQAKNKTSIISENPAFKNQIHPFLGWTVRPGTQLPSNENYMKFLKRFFQENATEESFKSIEEFSANIFGFHSRENDYRAGKKSDFIIGIFGGSVAQGVAFNSEMIKRELSQWLSLPTKSILVYNFAAGGYKQPQQLIALMKAIILGIHLDVIVNIDGFNEVALGGTDAEAGYHPVFPTRMHFLPLFEFANGIALSSSIEKAADIIREKKDAEKLKKMVQNSWLNKSEFAKAFMGALVLKHLKKSAAIEKSLQEKVATGSLADNLISSLPDECLDATKPCWSLIADIWARSSLSMNALALHIDALYLNILQPNQYIKGSKILSNEELEHAYFPEDQWSRYAVTGYPYLQDRSNLLKAKKVAFYDLTDIFSKTSNTIYIDRCCHFNQKGYQILIKTILRHIKNECQKRPGKCLN